jgi:hypothetical protein
MLNVDKNAVSKYANYHCAAIIGAIDSGRRKGLKNRAYFENVFKKVFPKRKGITLEQVILADPEELERLFHSRDRVTHNRLFEARPGKRGCKKPTEATRQFLKLYKLLDNPLTYAVGDDKKKWSRHDFFKTLGYSTCPYCNRNIIRLIDIGSDSTLQSGDLDHVIPKTKYPIFCVSFYNLIPACKVCNFLKKEEEGIPSPYDSKIKLSERFRFGIEVVSPRFPSQTCSFEITYNTDLEIAQDEIELSKVKQYWKVFKIKEQYKHHKDVAQEIIQKQFIFNESYRSELMKRYGGTLFRSEGDLYRALFGRYENEQDMHRRPLSRFIRDIQDHLEGKPAGLKKIDD